MMSDTPNLTEGMELETADGESVEITNERGDGRLCLYFPERERDGGAYTEWRHPSAISGAISDGVFTVVGEDTTEDAAEDHPGEWGEDTPRCPVCSRFMSTGMDGGGFPIARCSRLDCPGVMDVDELIDGGYFVED